jgi:hypothetical protein
MTSGNCLRRVTGLLLLYLGDISRYQNKMGLKPNLEESWSFYNRSKAICPFEGKVYH